MTIYEIDSAIMECFDENGEVLDAEKLDALVMERDAKIEGVAICIKNLKAEAEALKNEETSLKERREAKEKKADSMQNWLAETLGGQVFETTKCKLSWRKSTKVNVIDEMLIPAEYMTEKVTRTPNKTLIKSAIQGGATVLGCELSECNNLQIK